MLFNENWNDKCKSSKQVHEKQVQKRGKMGLFLLFSKLCHVEKDLGCFISFETSIKRNKDYIMLKLAQTGVVFPLTI